MRRWLFLSALGAVGALLAAALLRSSRREVEDLDAMLRRLERWDRFSR